MPAKNIWIPSERSPNPVTLLNTELNSIANNAMALGSAFTNTEYDLYCDFEVLCQYGTAPTADSTIDIYWVRSLDGTNFEDASAARPPGNGMAGAASLAAVTTLQRLNAGWGILVPVGTWKPMAVNRGGQALAGSGVNYLRAYFYSQGVR